MKRIAIFVSMFCTGCLGLIDGSSGPAPEDPPPGEPPPPPAEVQLTVQDATGPLAGIAVVFMNTDDSVASDVVTDAQGIAHAQLPNGGSVTVVQPGQPGQPGTSMDPTAAEPSPAQIYTYVGVKPGDNLQVLVPTAKTTTPVTARITVPTTEDLSPIAVITPCGSAQGSGPSIDVTLQGCGAETDFYVVDLGSNVSFLKRAPIGTTVDLSGETFADSLSSTLSVTNAPAGVGVAIESRLETDLFRPLYSSGMIPVADGTTATVNVPNLPTAEQHISVALYGPEATELVTVREPYGQAPLAVDVGPYLIKSASAPAIAADSLTWTEKGTGAPDLVIARVSATRITRSIVAAYASPSLRIPHLPAAYDAYNVQSTDSPSISLAKASDGIDGVRLRVFGGPLAPLGGYATTTSSGGANTAGGDPTKP